MTQAAPLAEERRLLMGSHHDGDETEGSVHSSVQDYIEARKASRSVRRAGPKDLTVTVHWPNSKPWSESQSQGPPPPPPNPESEDGGRSVAVEKMAQSSRRGKVVIQRRGEQRSRGASHAATSAAAVGKTRSRGESHAATSGAAVGKISRGNGGGGVEVQRRRWNRR